MKKRNLLRAISLILMLGMLFSTATASQAQPRYVKIHTLTSELLGINWLGKANCCGSVTVLDSSCMVELYVELQQSDDGVNGWTTIKSWSTTGSGELAIEENHYVSSGYYYRVVTCAMVFTASGAYIEAEALESAIFYH